MIGESAGRSRGNAPRPGALRRFEMDERAELVGSPEDENLEFVPHAEGVVKKVSWLTILAVVFATGIILGAYIGVGLAA